MNRACQLSAVPFVTSTALRRLGVIWCLVLPSSFLLTLFPPSFPLSLPILSPVFIPFNLAHAFGTLRLKARSSDYRCLMLNSLRSQQIKYTADERKHSYIPFSLEMITGWYTRKKTIAANALLFVMLTRMRCNLIDNNRFAAMPSSLTQIHFERNELCLCLFSIRCVLGISKEKTRERRIMSKPDEETCS